MIGGLRRLVPNFIRRSYALKFGIALLIMGLMVGTIGLVATAQIKTEVQSSVNNEIAGSAAQQARNVHAWDEQNKRSTRAITETQSLRVGEDEQQISTVLTNWKSSIESQGKVLDIYYVNVTSGRIQVATDSDDRGRALSKVDAPWATNIEKKLTNEQEDSDEQNVYRSEAYGADIGGGTKEPAIAYVDSANPTQYVVFVVRLADYSGNMGQSASSATYVVEAGSGGKEKILFNSGTANILDDYNGDAGTKADVVKEASGLSYTKSGYEQSDHPPKSVYAGSNTQGLTKDANYVVGYAKVQGTNWVVLVHKPASAAYGFVEQVQNYGYAATMGGVLLIGLVGAVLGRNTAASIDRLRTKTEQMEQGNLNVDFETRRVDNIGRLYGGFASMRDALREQIQEARDAREEAEIARGEAEQMTEHLERKATAYSGVMQDVGDGDLTRRLDPESESQAMTDIAHEFNDMIAEIEQTTEQLKNFANEVATSSEEVTASSEEVRSASEQVTESIQEISDGAERQNEQLQSVNQEMSGLSTTVEQIASSSNEVADLAERTAQTGRDGRDAAQEAIDRMTTLEDEREVVTSQIRDLEDEVEQIDELLEFITDIADQTNMLALNANIEAARSADSGGEGFGVVAQEVKDLAEETKDAAEDIEERLGRIQTQTRQTAQGVESASEQISGTTDAVHDAVDALDEIADYAQETNTGVQEISAATEEQAASTQEVVAMVDEAATISEETTAESENVAAAAEEQTTALTEVSQSASDLAQQASRLSEALDRFDTDSDAGFEFPLGDEEKGAIDLPKTDAGTAAADEALSELSGGDFDVGEDDDERGTPQLDDAETVDDAATAGAGSGFGGGAATFDEADAEDVDAADAEASDAELADGELTDDGSFEVVDGADGDAPADEGEAVTSDEEPFDLGGAEAETPASDESVDVEDEGAAFEESFESGAPDFEAGDEPDAAAADESDDGEALEFGSADDGEALEFGSGDDETVDVAADEPEIDFGEELGQDFDADTDAELDDTAGSDDEAAVEGDEGEDGADADGDDDGADADGDDDGAADGGDDDEAADGEDDDGEMFSFAEPGEDDGN